MVQTAIFWAPHLPDNTLENFALPDAWLAQAHLLLV